MKRILIALVALSLVGCDTGKTEVQKTPNQISSNPGFEDCISYVGYIDGWRTVVVRCPNSDVTSTWQGKHNVNTVTTDSKPPSADVERAKAEVEYARAQAERAQKAANEAQIRAETAKKIYEQLK